jgi:hypothetical protein
MEEVACRGFYLLKPGVAKFEYLAAVHTNEMVMVPVAVRLLIHGMIGTELMFGNQLALHQHIKRIVHGGAAHIAVIALHLQVQFFRIEVVFAIVNFLEDGKALRCLALLVIFKIGSKNVLYF